MTLLEIGFRDAQGQYTTAPPMEDLNATPPSLGAPLNLTIVFRFDGIPAPPIDDRTLPVFTTPAEVTPLALAPALPQMIPAEGTYVLVGEDVEFRPTVPSAPLQIPLSAPAAARPGLLPGSTYTARVPVVGTTLGNIQGAGGQVRFETTSNPATYYPKEGDDQPPRMVSSDPVDGTDDFDPATWSEISLETGEPLFPPGPSEVVLAYDHQVLPTSANLSGSDLDGDGVRDPMFYFATRGTELLVSHEVPDDTLGSHPAFHALSGLDEGATADPAGDDIFLHDDASGALPEPEAGLDAVPTSLANGPEPALLYALLPPVGGGAARLTVLDHVLGDPSHARLANDAGEGSQALDTGLLDPVGLVTLADGRLLAYDRDTRRIHELIPTVERRRGGPDDPAPGPPQLLDLVVGDGSDGFRSEAYDAGLDVLDLARAPSGELFALAHVGGATEPSLLRLEPIDPEADGRFGSGEGLFSGDAADVAMVFDVPLADVIFESELRLLALDRTTDRILRYALGASGPSGTVVDGVAAFGHPLGGLPDGLSPARALAFGELQLEAQATLLSNDDAGAQVRLEPVGVLPPDAELWVMQRRAFQSLAGVNEANALAPAYTTPSGAVELLALRTAAPLSGPEVFIDDVFLEEFGDRTFEDPQPSGVSPQAEWAENVSLGDGGLRAAGGVSATANLGDFLPLGPGPEFDPAKAYTRSSFSEGDIDLDPYQAGYKVILLDTDGQNFPLPDGSTPGITSPVTVQGGNFIFRDFIIPEGVRVVVKGSRPLRITATRRLEIHGLLELKGTDGWSDHAFDSAVLPIAGGPGGPGAGRGGDGQPTLFDPSGPGTLDQYVTPETGEHGYAPVVSADGSVSFQPVGGRGGLSVVGYYPNPGGFTKLTNSDGTEHHRPAGGGGGSFYERGGQAHTGAGAYLVQSNSTWFPFDKCILNDKKRDSLYGNNEQVVAGVNGAEFTQCVYLTGTTDDPDHIKPGGLPGDAIFADATADNDYIGPGGELEVLIGGQGGGGGGTRVDSFRHIIWARNSLAAPEPQPPAPPFYPKLLLGSVYTAPSVYDSRGGGGGGGAGSVHLRCFGDIIIGRTGYIDASGGHGGGGEMLENSNWTGGGGGGSGGAILVEAANELRIEADAGHRSAGYVDLAPGGGMRTGAALDVSGGFGRDARTFAQQAIGLFAFSWEHTRGDGGQGGFGMIQLSAGGASGLPQVEEGAFLFAKKRGTLKRGKWNGFINDQREHPEFSTDNHGLPDAYRYIDMLHYRFFKPEGPDGPTDVYYTLNGTYPPLIERPDGTPGPGPEPANEFPPGSGKFYADTKMMSSALSGGRLVVQDPEPEWLIKDYNGYDPVTFNEINFPDSHPDFPGMPGTNWAGEEVPFSTMLTVPEGTPILVENEETGEQMVDPVQMVDRLPLVHPLKTPPQFGSASLGMSRWLDFNGVAGRTRDGLGRTPPFFRPVHGTHNTAIGPVAAGKHGRVRLGAPVPVPSVAAHFVEKTGSVFDPGLFGNGTPTDPPYNDIKVDAPDPGVLLNDVVTDNAHVRLEFQGARPVRSGSHDPDPATVTEWLTDLTQLNGYELVRFRVEFDLSADPEDHPFGVESMRPRVDYVRMRADY